MNQRVLAAAGCFAVFAVLGQAPAKAELPELRAESLWKQDISSAPVDPESATVIAWMDSQGGFCTFDDLRIDFSLDRVETVGGDPLQPVTEDAQYFEPDCDAVQTIPLPVGGTVEGNSGYECLTGGDCHLLVWDAPSSDLFELWNASLSGGTLTTSCLVVWNLQDLYPVGNRGPSCVSADPSGMPIAPLLLDAEASQ